MRSFEELNLEKIEKTELIGMLKIACRALTKIMETADLEVFKNSYLVEHPGADVDYISAIAHGQSTAYADFALREIEETFSVEIEKDSKENIAESKKTVVDESESNKSFAGVCKAVSASQFQDCFYYYFVNAFRHWDVASLVEQERVLGKLLENDLVLDCILLDEMQCLYDLVRDECVYRCSLFPETLADDVGIRDKPRRSDT